LLRRPKQWSKFSQASLAIGYEISVTPLQMLLAYGALANGGYLMEPRLVREVRSRDGRVTNESKPRVVRRVIPQEVASDLRKVLVGVVENGTGKQAGLGPFEVAGKTGTARSFRAGHYEAGAYTASFAGFFPAEDPQLVFIVKLDAPQGVYYGGFAAAPVTRATLEAALAARSTPLDKSAMAVSAPPLLPGETALRRSGGQANNSVRVVRLDRPNNRLTARPPDRQIPPVVGLPLRDAIRQLHKSGYHVQVDGSGLVSSVEQLRGNVVHVAASEVTP
jgi:cell division protein FtsI (penicillin-binding protein 3)